MISTIITNLTLTKVIDIVAKKVASNFMVYTKISMNDYYNTIIFNESSKCTITMYDAVCTLINNDGFSNYYHINAKKALIDEGGNVYAEYNVKDMIVFDDEIVLLE